MNGEIAIICDFDGTIAVRDVGHHFFGSMVDDTAVWEELLEKWKIGLISSKECLTREMSMIDACREDLDRFIENEKLDIYFKDFVDFCEKRMYEFVILSDGMDYYIESMLMNNGLGYLDFRANHLVFEGDRLSRIEFPWFDRIDCTLCGNCKKYHIEEFKRKGLTSIYIGNGYSDRCPSEYADIIFAKSDLLDHCRQKGIDHIEFGNFRDVERELTEILYR